MKRIESRADVFEMGSSFNKKMGFMRVISERKWLPENPFEDSALRKKVRKDIYGRKKEFPQDDPCMVTAIEAFAALSLSADAGDGRLEEFRQAAKEAFGESLIPHLKFVSGAINREREKAARKTESAGGEVIW